MTNSSRDERRRLSTLDDDALCAERARAFDALVAADAVAAAYRFSDVEAEQARRAVARILAVV